VSNFGVPQAPLGNVVRIDPVTTEQRVIASGGHRTATIGRCRPGGSLESPAGIAFFPAQTDQTRHVRVRRLARSTPQRPVGGGARTRSFFDVLQVRNVGSVPIPSPVTLDGLPSTARVVAPDGVTRYTTPSGSPLHTVDVGSDGVLTPGEVSVMVVQIETDRSHLPHCRIRVLAGPGAR
jgi:hypothetical protein